MTEKGKNSEKGPEEGIVEEARESIGNILKFEDKEYELDMDRHLSDWSVWKEGMADVMAKEDGFDLKEAHMDVIRFARKWYENYFTVLNDCILPKLYGDSCEKEVTFDDLNNLFEEYLAKRVAKYAGLPNPNSY